MIFTILNLGEYIFLCSGNWKLKVHIGREIFFLTNVFLCALRLI